MTKPLDSGIIADTDTLIYFIDNNPDYFYDANIDPESDEGNELINSIIEKAENTDTLTNLIRKQIAEADLFELLQQCAEAAMQKFIENELKKH